MIAKEKDAYSGDDERAKYGHRQEEDVAFHLRRAFGNESDVVIFNDLRLKYEDENAQIDHLIMHPFGFIIIESKSISGEVRVNATGEWQRSYRDNWMGLKSPLRQAELQQDILKRLLNNNRTQLMSKILGLQGGFSGRHWKVLCALSSNAIVHREEMSKALSAQVVKPEFLHDQINNLIGSRSKMKRTLIFDTRPEFSADEHARITEFLLKQDARSRRAYTIESVRNEISGRSTDKQQSVSSMLASAAQKEVPIEQTVGAKSTVPVQQTAVSLEQRFQPLDQSQRSDRLEGIGETRDECLVVSTAVSESDALGVPPIMTEHPAEKTATLAVPDPELSAAPTVTQEVLISCRQCKQDKALMGCYGKFGYYVKCRDCSVNTSMKQGCPACCHSSVRISKAGVIYRGHCPECTHEFVIFRQMN